MSIGWTVGVKFLVGVGGGGGEGRGGEGWPSSTELGPGRLSVLDLKRLGYKVH